MKITKNYIDSLKNSLLIHADCIGEMKMMDENIFDSGVIDPPYSISFLGKEWDTFEGAHQFQSWCEDWAVEALRVVKPGGYILSFGSTRTFHQLVSGLDGAGWEIRDTIAWCYSSGYPKSHNIANDLDKMQGFGCRGHAVATASKFHPTTGLPLPSGQKLPKYKAKTKLAKVYEGWGTGLKPAMELICLARKPLSENSVAENVLRWGTGGLNIDACRIPLSKEETNKIDIYDASGRWPSNMTFSEEMAILLKSQNKVIPSFYYCPKPSDNEKNDGLKHLPKVRRDIRTDKAAGVMSKKGVQPQENLHPTIKPVDLLQYLCRLITPTNGVILDCFMGSGSCGIAAVKEGFRYVGIELEEEYFEIAKLRIKHNRMVHKKVRFVRQ